MNRDTCVHTFHKDGEAIKTGGNGRTEQYREIFACVFCGAVSRGPWQVRRIVVPERPRRTAEELAEMRASLYGPE